MSLRPITSLDAPEDMPKLNNGVPGAQFGNHDDPSAKRGKPAMPSDDQESYFFYVALVFGIALVLRLLVVMMGPMSDIENAYTAETPHQQSLAANLAEHKAFGLETQPAGSITERLDTVRHARGELTPIEGTTLIPEAYETPGYAAVLSVLEMTGLGAQWLLVVQCLLGAACVPLVFGIGMGVLGRKLPSMLAAVVVALHPAMLIAPAALAGDVIVALLVLVALWGVAHAERRNLQSVAGGGMAIGVAALFSPILAWLAPLLAAWMVISERRLRSVAMAVLLVIATAIPVGGWSYRNAQHGLDPWISAKPAVDRLFGTVAMAENPLAGPYATQTTDELFQDFEAVASLPENAEQSTLSLLDEYGRDRLNADRAQQLDVIAQSSFQLALDHSLDEAYARMGIEYVPAGYAAELLSEDVASATPEENVTEWVINVWVALNAALVVAMAVGAVMMLWRRRIGGLVLLLLVTGFAVFASSFGVSESTRLPLIGMQGLLVMAMFAPAPIRVKKPKKRKIKKFEKIEDGPQSRTFGSPLAAAPAPAPAGAPAMGSGDISLKDAVHPALAAAPPAEADTPATDESETFVDRRKSSSDEASAFATRVEDERLERLATSGRPI